MNDSRWQVAIGQIFKALVPGGWVELVEVEAKRFDFGVGPHSKKLVSLAELVFVENEVVGDLSVYLPTVLEKAGFVDIRCESRDIPIRQSIGDGLDRSKQWYELWKGMKKPMLAKGGYGIIKTAEQYDELLEGCLMEWMDSQDAHTTYYTIIARKPIDV